MISIMDPYLISENEEIRNYATEVFIILFRRQNDKVFIESNLDNSIMRKLNTLSQNGQQKEVDLLMTSMKKMIKKSIDLRLQDRLLSLCGTDGKTTPFTLVQAIIIKAIAPVISSKIFSKRIYYVVLRGLNDELEAKVLRTDEDTTQAMLHSYAEILSGTTKIDQQQSHDEIEKFYDACLANGRPGLYIDLMAVYCAHELTEIDNDEADVYLGRILKYMNNPDAKLVEKVILCMNALFNKLPKESQFLLVPTIRYNIEDQAISFIPHVTDSEEDSMQAHLYHKKVQTIEMFRLPIGVSSLVAMIKEAIMHGSVHVRTASAFCFKYLLDFTPPEVIKKEVIKICGALIRVVNDKFAQELKLQIFFALRLIQLKGTQAAKGMQPQLQTTFLKTFGDP
jgi:hypothetical protein